MANPVHTPVRDLIARNKLAVENMGLLGQAVKVFSNQHSMNRDECEEAVQVGVFGLLRAAELWDETKGIKFSTYAVVSILSRVTRWFSSQRLTVAYPYLRSDKPNPRRMARHSLEFFNSDTNELNADRRWNIEQLLCRWDNNDLVKQEELELLNRSMGFLTADQIEIIHLRFYFGWTLKIIANYLGVSRETVNNRINAAINRLRQLFKLPLPPKRR